ncbi:MAG: D-lyxose/D-mannose family sugar isomerase, partial [Treponema sp.]|nr:D-lyxose/D-mannose family sugar isomerase [Treponema sp.]
MKRSEINSYIRNAKSFIQSSRFKLPPFAFWSPEEWKTKGAEYSEIAENQLGWDLTDFGSGNYEKIGLLLFTIRNGNYNNPKNQKTYAEKLMICMQNQVTPFHYHQNKMEDIIVRGGDGCLAVRLYASEGPHKFDEKSPVPVAVDGRNYTVPAGSIVRLSQGESITLFRGVFHEFWADITHGNCLLLGEVSMVNDDHNDNFFYKPAGRFPDITEDEKPLHLLVGD